MPYPYGHIHCAVCETYIPYGQVTRVRRAWSSRFPFRVFRDGPPSPVPRWVAWLWLNLPVYLCPVHTALVEMPRRPLPFFPPPGGAR